ncbi:MAG: LuxR C-terminal-related transcriptional regulator [Candidatus Aminicenantes bacterium]
MNDKNKSKEQLIEELSVVRQRITDLEKLENRRAQASLKETQIRLKGILSSMVDLVFALDKEGRFIFYHAPRKEDLYLPPEEFIGKNHREVLPTYMIDRFETAFKMNKKGETVEYEYWMEMKGRKKWFFAKLSPLFLDGKFAGSLAVVRDITDRKRTQDELKKYRERLEDLVKKRTSRLEMANKQLIIEINKRKEAEVALKKSEAKLRKQKTALEQKNIALGEIIAQIEIEKRKIKEDILANANIVLFPILDKLKVGVTDQKDLILLEHHIKGLTSAYGDRITDKALSLTPKEIEVCNLVKAGFANKDISRFLNISCQTVEGHRKKIRHKLGISNKSINLTTYLREI